eukprot:15453551-Alexandrium_andersonii.AAC.1
MTTGTIVGAPPFALTQKGVHQGAPWSTVAHMRTRPPRILPAASSAHAIMARWGPHAGGREGEGGGTHKFVVERRPGAGKRAPCGVGQSYPSENSTRCPATKNNSEIKKTAPPENKSPRAPGAKCSRRPDWAIVQFRSKEA